MEGFETNIPTIMKRTGKTASFLNILPFILLYILKNHTGDTGKPGEVKDKLYDYIPNKSKSFNPNLKYWILAVPALVLLFKSTDNTSLEHAFVLLSYTIGIKALMYYLTPSQQKRDFTNIIAITIVFNLIYFDIIPKEHRDKGLLLSGMYSVFLLSIRDTTSANIISDYSIASLAFLLGKLS